jgi:hypothetical protein
VNGINGIVSSGFLDVFNSGSIEGLGGTAIDAGISSVVRNVSGTIRAVGSGAAIDASSLLDLQNLAGRIEAIGTADAVTAGLLSKITNQAGAHISAQLGTAIEAAIGLDLTNGYGSTVTSQTGTAVDAGYDARITNSGEISSNIGAAIEAGSETRIQNRPFGTIASTLGPALAGAGNLDLRNDVTARVSSRFGPAVTHENGIAEIDNHGTIESDLGPAVEASGFQLIIGNRSGGVLTSRDGIAIDSRAYATRIDNQGLIAGWETAIDLSRSGLAGDELALEFDSLILGDVVFGESDDTLRVGDIKSGLLIDGLFDGGAGFDSALFSASYDLSDVLSVDYTDMVTVELVLRATNGDVLLGTYRNFENFRIAGTDYAFAELGDILTPVPLPAALPLLVAGIGGLTMLRRRR